MSGNRILLNHRGWGVNGGVICVLIAALLSEIRNRQRGGGQYVLKFGFEGVGDFHRMFLF